MIVAAMLFVFGAATIALYLYSVARAWKCGYFAGALAACYMRETGCTSKEAAAYAVKTIRERGFPSDI